MDCTNPINGDFSGVAWDGAPSGGELVAGLAPNAKVVKAFNTVGFNVMEDPNFSGTPATMLIATDDAGAFSAVADLASQIGFQPENAGPLSQARWLEAFAWVWISMAMKYGHGRDIAFVLHKR